LDRLMTVRTSDWRCQGIRVVRAGERSSDTPDTVGMNREVAISGSRIGSTKLWAGTNRIEPGAATGAHHHGDLHSVIYIVRGNALMRWGDRLEWITTAGPGDFLHVPPWVPHQELNASADEELHCVLVRSGPEELVVNLEVDPVADPEWVLEFDTVAAGEAASAHADDATARLAAAYSAHHQLRRAQGEFIFVPERLPLLVAAVGGPGRDVLDLGCRTGAGSVNYLPGNRIVGIDIDPDALAVAAGRGIEPVWGDLEAPLPFEDASFDVVVAGELLEHVRAPAEVVAEVRRVLRPGGTFAGSVPNAYRVQDRLGFLRGRPPDPDPTHLHMYSPPALRELLSAFRDVRLDFVGGRYRPLHARLLARDLVFRGTR
jgi:uncharacterized RmlC-like cupin family protein/SAM-dependent methyltransferase